MEKRDALRNCAAGKDCTKDLELLVSFTRSPSPGALKLASVDTNILVGSRNAQHGCGRSIKYRSLELFIMLRGTDMQIICVAY